MKITQLAILAISSASAQEVAANPELARASKLADSPRDGKTEGSPNARLRGALWAEGVRLENRSDSAIEGRFETGSCVGWSDPCSASTDCCNGLVCKNKNGGITYSSTKCFDCKPEWNYCGGDEECCSGLTCRVVSDVTYDRKVCKKPTASNSNEYLS